MYPNRLGGSVCLAVNTSPGFRRNQKGEIGMIGDDVDYSQFPKYHEPVWAADAPIPAIGTRLHECGSRLGPFIVKKYFFEHGYIGLLCELEDPPEWFKKQKKQFPEMTGALCHLFPAEIEELRDDVMPSEEQDRLLKEVVPPRVPFSDKRMVIEF